MCFANMPSTNHHYSTFARILDPAGFHPGALCGANRPVCEMVFRLFVIESVFFTDTYLNRRIVPRVIWLQKTICRTVITDNLIWNSQSSKIILSQSTDRWICLVDIGKCKSILKKKHILNLEMAMWYVYVACQHGWRQFIFKKTWIMCRCACGFAACVFTNGCKTKKYVLRWWHSLLSLHS